MYKCVHVDMFYTFPAGIQNGFMLRMYNKYISSELWYRCYHVNLHLELSTTKNSSLRWPLITKFNFLKFT